MLNKLKLSLNWFVVLSINQLESKSNYVTWAFGLISRFNVVNWNPIKLTMFVEKENKVGNSIKSRFSSKETGDVRSEATCKVHFVVYGIFLWKIDTWNDDNQQTLGHKIAIKTETLCLRFLRVLIPTNEGHLMKSTRCVRVFMMCTSTLLSKLFSGTVSTLCSAQFRRRENQFSPFHHFDGFRRSRDRWNSRNGI